MPKPRITQLALLLLVVSSSCLVIQAQEQEPEKQTEPEVLKIKIDLVQLRAVVTDKSGKPIDNLKQEDFEVLENAKPQKISFFSLESISTQRAPLADAAQKTPAPDDRSKPNSANAKPVRTIVLFVDTLHLTPVSLIKAKQQLKKFIDEQITDDDMVAVVTTSNSLGVLGQFMRDRKLLKRAIDQITPFVRPRTLFSPYLAAKVLSDTPGALSVASDIVKNEEFSDLAQPPQQYVEARAREILRDEEIRRKATWLTLKAVAERMTEMSGQRLIAFMSDGFTLLSDGGGMDNQDFNAATSRAVQSGVVIYSFSPQGLTTPVEHTAGVPLNNPEFASYMADTLVDQQNTLRNAANDTGGEAYLNSNDIPGQMKKMLNANQLYYSLAYYPQDRSGKKFRNLKIRVLNHPEYRVRTQRGYQPLAETKADVAATPRQKLFHAMISPLPATAIPVVSSASFLERADDNNQVTLQVHLSGDLEYPKKQDKFNLNCELAIAVLDHSGKIANTFADAVRTSFTAEKVEQARKKGYRYTRRIKLAPGLYQIRIGVRDVNSERIGTSTAWVEVPELRKQKLALSALFLAKNQEQNQANAKEKQSRPQLVIGPGSFKTGEPIFYRFVVYAAAQTTGNLLLKLDVLNNGTPVYEGEWHPLNSRVIRSDLRGMEIGGQLQMRFDAGFYTLRVSVKDPRAKKTSEQTIDLELEP